jgi:hypothetical protein
MLPPVRVKSEFKNRVRIAWCHNIGTNIVEQAIFKDDDDTYQKWDNIWADIYFQFYQDAGANKRENHNIGIGNVKCLEDWTEFLPPYPINVDQPWFYGFDPATAYPLKIYKNSQTRVEHRYTMRRKITDLLRVQILGKDQKWKDTTSKVHKYLDVSSSSTIKTPELWGRYAYITDAEIKWYKCEQNRTFYIRDTEVCDTQNPCGYKSTAEIALHCTNPCLAFFWVAENVDATSNHNYSNYTTDTQDLYSGWDPIKSTTLKYGTTVRLDNMPSDHFSIAECRKHFPSAPCERGYHGYSYAWNSTNYHGDIGIVLANMKAKLYCSIFNNNIFTSVTYDDDDDDDDDELEIADAPQSSDFDHKARDVKSTSSVSEDVSPGFMIRSRLLVLRKFTISAIADNKYKYTVI